MPENVLAHKGLVVHIQHSDTILNDSHTMLSPPLLWAANRLDCHLGLYILEDLRKYQYAVVERIHGEVTRLGATIISALAGSPLTDNEMIEASTSRESKMHLQPMLRRKTGQAENHSCTQLHLCCNAAPGTNL